ncbi:MAG TPA: hypothetical protein VFC51_02235 [Chloroflexota bacterium]|nr:hypothetical protein [Chloroflexota bacterium]
MGDPRLTRRGGGAATLVGELPILPTYFTADLIAVRSGVRALDDIEGRRHRARDPLWLVQANLLPLERQ